MSRTLKQGHISVSYHAWGLRDRRCSNDEWHVGVGCLKVASADYDGVKYTVLVIGDDKGYVSVRFARLCSVSSHLSRLIRSDVVPRRALVASGPRPPRLAGWRW
jgi:hypothetical protein